MSELGARYQGLIGARLAAVAWQPIACDTPGVVADLHLPKLQFSGAVSLHFGGGRAISLTWKNERSCYLTIAESGSWHPFALDAIHSSGERPWYDLISAELRSVELFRDSRGSNNVIAARHVFETQRGTSSLWVGVGDQEQMLESDDLLVLLDQEPSNRAELTLVEAVGTT